MGASRVEKLMKDTVLKIALAGLGHDIGKFAQGSLPVSREYLNNNAGLYQPFRNGHYTHVHAVYTAAFIEQMADRLPEQLNRGGWGKGDSFINLAAGHHNPKTRMQWIVAMADRISSGLDRDTFEKGEKIAFQDVKKTRLLPVLECLGPKRCKDFNNADRFRFSYPLSPLSAQNIFPQESQGRDYRQAAAEYQRLFDRFCGQLKGLYHCDTCIELWAQHFDSLLMTYTSLIPAARVGDVVYDVSLYDHCRSTAALAAALYLYHVATDSMDIDSIRRNEPEKFLLVSSDFYGIQDFIFSSGGESCRFRSKLLRGRSFAVSLFSDLAADLLCRRLGLPFLSVILNAAGKSHLIAPNTQVALETIDRVREEINDWLFSISYGQTSMGIIATPASPDEFHNGRFADLWQRHMDDLEIGKHKRVDLTRHGGVVTDFLDQFDNGPERPLCPLCGKRPASAKTINDPLFRDDTLGTCEVCRDHVMLGTHLVKKKMLAVCPCKGKKIFAHYINRGKGLMVPIFGSYQVMFTDSDCKELAQKGYLYKLWELGANDAGVLDSRATVHLINGYVPIYSEADNMDNCLLESAKGQGELGELIDEIREGAPKTLGHIAIKARYYDPEKDTCMGTEALGVLKADVDHLGMLLACGLPQKRITFSRLATLSRQLHHFFCLYLPNFLATNEQFSDVYTVFAGGDDLFLIGPWDRMADLAIHLQKRFADYVCNNNEITFSVGITVHKPHVPIDRLAGASEVALAAAKDAGRNRVSMFGKTVTWKEFKELTKDKEVMQNWLDRKYLSRVMFYRLNYFIELAEREAQLTEASQVEMDAIECVKWPALFRYSLARNLNTKLEDADQVKKEVAAMALWLKDYRGAMRIPLWQILYELRI